MLQALTHQGWHYLLRAPLDTAQALLVFLCTSLRDKVCPACLFVNLRRFDALALS
jgi:hypothetical protein